MTDEKTTLFSKREFEIATLLKDNDIEDVAKILKTTRATIDTTLYRMRNKLEKAINTVNTANNWKDSSKNPRLAKLLRRYDRGE